MNGMFLRNFLVTIKRFKLACGLNIVGLSVAFGAFIVILMQVSYERGFDKGYPRQVYRVEVKDSTMHEAILARPMIDVLLAGSPAIAQGTMRPCYLDNRYVSLERNGAKVAYIEPYTTIYPDDFEVFGYELTEGTREAFDDHTKLILPQSMARKFFGTESAIGKLVTFEMGEKSTVEVGAVYRDFPANSSVPNCIKQKIAPEEHKNSWGAQNYWCFVTLWPGSDPEAAARQMTQAYAAFGKPDWISGEPNFILQPIEEVYYDKTVGYDTAPKGNRTTMTLLLSIALLVIGIAAVNFVNFATSLTPLRIKNINTRKVLGSPVGTLRAELVFESAGIALLGFCLALLWVYLLRDTGFNELISGGISFSTYSGVIWLGLGVALGVGILAGIYPAVYTTSFPPALVLKGTFGLSPKGRKLRTALIGFQFVVSLGLIVAAMFMQLQNRYLRGINTGLDYEGIAMARMGGELRGSKAFQERVVQSPLVEEVGYSERPRGLTDLHSQWGRELRGTTILFAADMVSWNLPRMLGVELVDGDYFTETDARREGCYHYLFNESAAREFGLSMQEPLNERGWGGEARLTGIARNFNYGSLHAGVGPMAMVLVGRESGLDADRLQTAYFKIKGDPYAAVKHIRRAAAEIDPAYPVDLQFFDAAFDALYRKELKVTTLITVFSLLAVVLSLVGVFGLVVFETQYRRKEIGVRKVMGATVAEILAMFNRSFVRLVLICFVVAAPLAWYGVREWLGTFAYRTPVYWWVFAVSLAIVLFITLATVTIQSWRAATANPVEAFKTE